jgi:hypothetical protein
MRIEGCATLARIEHGKIDDSPQASQVEPSPGVVREFDGQAWINDQWRLCFRFAEGDAFEVEIED